MEWPRSGLSLALTSQLLKTFNFQIVQTFKSQAPSFIQTKHKPQPLFAECLNQSRFILSINILFFPEHSTFKPFKIQTPNPQPNIYLRPPALFSFSNVQINIGSSLVHPWFIFGINDPSSKKQSTRPKRHKHNDKPICRMSKTKVGLFSA